MITLSRPDLNNISAFACIYIRNLFSFNACGMQDKKCAWVIFIPIDFPIYFKSMSLFIPYGVMLVRKMTTEVQTSSWNEWTLNRVKKLRFIPTAKSVTVHIIHMVSETIYYPRYLAFHSTFNWCTLHCTGLTWNLSIPRPIFRVQGQKFSMRKEKSYVWLSGTHVPTNQPEQEIGFRVHLDHKFIPFQHMWDARWMLRIHIYFPIYFESMSLVIPFELTRIIGRNRRIIFTTCLPRAGMLCEIHFSFSCNKGKIPITCKKRFVPSWVVLKAECQNAGMEECRNVGMSECRNVGMSECRNAGNWKPEY